jgi:hypothetical protein
VEKVFGNIAAILALAIGGIVTSITMAPVTELVACVIGFVVGAKGIGSKLWILAFLGIALCCWGVYQTKLIPGTPGS